MTTKLNAVPYLFCGLIAFPILAQTGGDPNNPPTGAPTQVYKTLDQIEPRTPLVDGAPGVTVAASGTITIDQSGSYYLAGNHEVTSGDGVRVTADGVTLDLRGFTIRTSSGASGSDGVRIQGNNITVFNGNIEGKVKYDENSGDYTGNGFINGVNAVEAPGVIYSNIRVRDLSVRGCLEAGIGLVGAESTLVESCVVRNVGKTGIEAEIVHLCSVHLCGEEGVNARLVSQTRAQAFGGSPLDGAIRGQIVTNSEGVSINGTGVVGQVVENSSGETTVGSRGISSTIVRGGRGKNFGDGLGIGGVVASGSYGTSTNGTGIWVNTVANSHGISIIDSPDEYGVRATATSLTNSVGGRSIQKDYHEAWGGF